HARERAFALLDAQSGKELIDPFEQMTAPNLLLQDIVPESDDGLIVVKGTIDQKAVVVIAMEGKFQGGGIGEVSGAKIIAALTQALIDNQNGTEIFPIFILDTGGVRLQEANYGLLSISEIGNLIVALKQYVPVIGIVPGRVGSFGGMSITSALMSYLIATKKARIGLNGPEVIEQEAGVREFDSSDKDLIWNTIGARQRLAAHAVDEVVVDTTETILAAVKEALAERKDTHRSERSIENLSLLASLDLSQPLAIDTFNQTIDHLEVEEIALPMITSGEQAASESIGYRWFEALSGIPCPQSSVSTVFYAPGTLGDQEVVFTSIVTDPENEMYRVRNGEVGLVEGFRMGQILEQIYQEDRNQTKKRPVIAIIDVPSQAYGYNEELIGIHIALATSAAGYAKLRQAGHPVIGLIVGNAISGAFLAHGLQSSRLVALNNPSINIQAMSKASAGRVTNRSIAEIEAAAQKVPAIAYDVTSFNKLGALYEFLTDITTQEPTSETITAVKEALQAAISDVVSKEDYMLEARYTNEQAQQFGRVETNKIREKMKAEW
ncbi:biotin-independent malonate decarboxylase subunit beta, partial [uncultured Enterococcus sp.]|uniref:biotin-independent malonate decarboxylase subunit beta n=1 Tax=uncultured Enterococcus sp. TaxID=167972 RepID=UPI0025DC1E86